MSKGIIDTNILVYAHDVDSIWHDKAKNWLESSDTTTFVITWQNLLEFYSIITDPRRVENPISISVTLEIIADFLESVLIIYPNKNTWKIFKETSQKLHKKGAMIYDLFLASTALSNNIDTIFTLNVRDFKAIDGIQVINPLA